jgi:hypothetical protein
MNGKFTWDKLCRKAGLSPKQKVLVNEYVEAQREEARSASEMSFSLALIESEHFGTRRSSTRLQRVKERAKEILNEEVVDDACSDL